MSETPAARGVRIQGILLPVEEGDELCRFDTDFRSDVDMPVFMQQFHLPIRLPQVQSKVLQL